jgi:autophagy-related protein 16-1
MNETLREKEEAARLEGENHRKARDEALSLRRKVEQHSELMAEKDRTAQVRVSFTEHINITAEAEINPSDP